MLLHLPLSYTVDERVGSLCLNKGDRKPNKGSVCQLLYGCCELLQRLAACLHPGLQLWSVGRASWWSPKRSRSDSTMSSYVASAGTVWRMSAALPCNTLKRWAAFSLGIQLFCTAAASNSPWNTAQNVAPSNFGGLTSGTCLLTAATRTSGPSFHCCYLGLEFFPQVPGLLFHHTGDIFLLLIQPLFQLCLTNHLFVFPAPPLLPSYRYPSCSSWLSLESWGQLQSCSYQTSVPHLRHSSVPSVRYQVHTSVFNSAMLAVIHFKVR